LEKKMKNAFTKLDYQTVCLKEKQKAFTLIELLVVIAIIALLMSVILPALGKAKEQVKAVVCSSNMRQLTTADLLYVEDNGTIAEPWRFAFGVKVFGSGSTLTFRWH